MKTIYYEGLVYQDFKKQPLKYMFVYSSFKNTVIYIQEQTVNKIIFKHKMFGHYKPNKKIYLFPEERMHLHQCKSPEYSIPNH